MSNDVPMLADHQQAPEHLNGRQPPPAAMNGKHSTKTEDYSMSEGDDVPLSQTIATSSSSARTLKRKKPVYAESSSSEDDKPLAASPVKKKPTTNGKKAQAGTGENSATNKSRASASGSAAKAKPPPKKKKVKDESDVSAGEGDDDEDTPPPPKRPAAAVKKRKSAVVKEESGSDDDAAPPPPKKPAKARANGKKPKEEVVSDATSKTTKSSAAPKAAKKEASESPKKGKTKAEKEEDQEDIYKWWEQGQDPNGDGSSKWSTLEHNGVYFPPPYETLPSNVKMLYKGHPVDLPPESEEVAGFYAALLETDHAKDATFNKNFFDDWKKVLAKYPPRNGSKIVDFESCDFRPMYEHFETEKAKRKAMTTEEKKAAKKAKEELESKYTHCVLDGRKEKVGNFRVEPPGLFRGRGDHPKKGALKLRVRPEDITINIGESAHIPIPNVPGNWKAVTHDNTVTWLANWTENINGNHKYVFLAAGSSLKGQSDMLKFEKARELQKHVDRIRQNYTQDLKSKVMADRQRATAMYFIDKLALRAGNEKGEDEADTVGCCSLRCEHVTLQPPDTIVFDFLGKDSIRYYNSVPVDAQVFKNIRIFKENKNDDDNLFDRVTTTSLNKHLTNEMKGLTAKVFRTFNASFTFQDLLEKEDLANSSLQEKLNAYNKANRLVAILCNHQRSVPKTHDQSMEKMRSKLRAFKYERMKLRHVLFKIDPKYKKDSRFKSDESDLEDDWIEEYEESLKAKDIEKAEKKFAKENEKLEEEGQKPQKDSVLKERIADIDEEYKRLAKERGTGKATLKRERAPEKIEEAIVKLADKIKSFKLQMVDRDAGKEVALGTSKINYLDPRITAAWCQKHDVPIEKIFSKTLLTKFPWAMEVEPDWKF